MSRPVDEMIGRQVGRYQIVRHLASGGMAELYIARQEAMGGFEKEIVVKILQPKFAENARVVQMFLDEARLAAKLNHQSIVHVYDVAEDGGLKYIAMEYIRGETLTDIVKRGLAAGKYLPLEHAVHVVRQTAAGLAYAHAWREPSGQLLRIVHRDVSPTNILVTMEGQTKIVDFGIARAQEELREEAGIVGKAGYMSPEQVRGDAVDTRSDIFSLGIILWELTLGQRLFRGTADAVMKRILDEKIQPPTAVQRHFPPALELIVMRALEKRPEDRYQSAEEMRVDLEEFLADEGLRTGSRRMALYMKEIFRADAGAASAPEAGVVPLEVRVREDSEELNFDRRAPLSLRFEAAPPEDEQSGSRFPPPLPRDDQVSSSPSGPSSVRGMAPVASGPASARGLAPVASGPPSVRGLAPVATGSTSGPPSARGLAPVAAGKANGIASAHADPAAPPPAPEEPPKSRRGWIILVFLLLGAAALAFVGTR